MNKKIMFILLGIIVCIFWLIVLPKSWEEEMERIAQENIKDLEQQKAEAEARLTGLKIEYAKTEQKLVDIHNEADLVRSGINWINSQLYWNPETDKVMDKICELSPESPMCNNWQMLHDLMVIAEARNVDYKLLLGIMYAESHIWANFKPYKCNITNNWAGLKARKYDDGSMSDWYNVQYQSLNLDLEGCWLYHFEDVNTFFESLANTISIGYAKCNEDPYCIMKSYVGHESGAWVRNVYLFKSL